MTYAIIKQTKPLSAKVTKTSAPKIRPRQANVQAKLFVGPSNDPLEREADRIANSVIARAQRFTGEVPTNDAVRSPDNTADALVQRKCSACSAEEEEPAAVRRKSADGGAAGDTAGLAPPRGFNEHLQRARTNGGRALAPELRVPMERGFSADFSRVRVHDDPGAAKLTRQVGARAFTIGSDVFFNSGELRPRTMDGQWLVAHELAHVVQQGHAGSRVLRAAAPSSDDVSLPAEEAAQTPTDLLKILTEDAANMADPAEARAETLLSIAPIHFDIRPVLDGLFLKLSEAELLGLVERFIAKVDDAAMGELLATPGGHSVLTMMVQVEQTKGKPLSGPILRYYGALSQTAVDKITAHNFASGEQVHSRDNPNGDDAENHCMTKVVTNIEYACGIDGHAAKIKTRAGELRQLPETKKSKDGKNTPLNSHNLQAATEMGSARRLGYAVSNRPVCTSGILYDPMNSPFSSDPFVIKPNARRSLLTPNPEQLMLDAVEGAPAGTYLFSASVGEHHSISIVLIKKAAGKVPLGSGDYSIIWNDQYTDGGKRKVFDPVDNETKEVDDGTTPGRLGEEIASQLVVKGPDKHENIVDRVFYADINKFSNPLKAEFWTKKANYARFMQDKDTNGAEGEDVRRWAAWQRCSNFQGIELWHVLPR